MKESADADYVQGLFDRIAPRYVLTNHILSGGLDLLWRRWVGKKVKKWHPKEVLDVACGTGDLALAVKKQCPEATLVGADFSCEMLQYAKKRGVDEVTVADALNLPFPDNSFDVVTVGFGLRNMEDWRMGLREMKRVTKEHGRVLIMDFSQPAGILGVIYGWYLHQILPKIAGILTGHSDAYHYLAKSISSFPHGEDFLQLLRSEGFHKVAQRRLTFGCVSVYWGKVHGDD